MKDGKLEVGDVVYGGYGSRTTESKYIIDRITKTLAISGLHRFNIKVGCNGSVYAPGGGVYSLTRYRVSTPELDEIHFRGQSENRIKSIDFSTLPMEKIKEIIEIINKK